MPSTIYLHENEEGKGQFLVDNMDPFPYIIKGQPIVVLKRAFYEVTVTMYADDVRWSAVPWRINEDGSLKGPTLETDLFLGNWDATF